MKLDQTNQGLRYEWLFFIVIIMFSLVRFFSLDADPGFLKNVGDAGDEGIWNANARNFVLYGKFFVDDLNLAMAGGTFYTIAVTFFYKLFGVSLYASRLPSAVFGILSILLCYLLVSRYSKTAGIVSALVLAVNHQFFIYTRIGHLETLCTFCLLLSFYMMIRGNFLVSGLFFGLSIASKLTMTSFIPVFLLFFYLEWLRKELTFKDVVKFFVGLGLTSLCLIAYIYHFYEYLAPSYAMWNRKGMLISNVHLIPRAFIDFFMSPYQSHPSIALLLILFGIYCTKLNILSLFGRNARHHLARLKTIDVLLISWVLAYSLFLIFFSDMSYRRLNLFTPALAMTAGLIFVPRLPTETISNSTRLQSFLRFSSFLIVGTLLGNKLLKIVFHDYSFWVALILSALGTLLLGRNELRLSLGLRKCLQRVSMALWLLIVTAPVLWYFFGNILGSLKITPSFPLKIGFGLIILMMVSLFALLANKSLGSAVIVMVVFNLGFISYDLICPTYSVKEVSLKIKNRVSPEDYVMSNYFAHALSLDGGYRPFFWSPIPTSLYRGLVNDRFVKTVKPKYLVREKSALDPDDDSLASIGVKEIRPLFDFGLYPVGRNFRYQLSFNQLVYE